jgi:uncharacterized protein YdeI (YjbR/CyaY-like superfamily)
MRTPNSKPVFFRTPAEFRAWLEKNHGLKQEVYVGFYKKDSGKPSITWPESVDAALSYGWIDGVRRSLDEVSYSIRFTPRKRSSIWSAINVKRVAELAKLGLMRPAGIRAFEARKRHKIAIYAYEQRRRPKLSPADEQQFQMNPKAWEYFQNQPAWYRRTAAHYVISGKLADTRQRRLAELIRDSEAGQAIKRLRRPVPTKSQSVKPT